MEVIYQDGKKIILVEKMFQLDNNQKDIIKKFIESIDEKEHDGKINTLKVDLTDNQKKEVIKLKNMIISNLKEYFEATSDEELVNILKKEEYIFFTTHSLERLNQRINSKNVQSQNPFNKLKKLDLPPQSIENLKNDVIQTFIDSNKVDIKVEYPPRDNETFKSYPRINYYKDMEKLRVCVEVKLEEDSSFYRDLFLIVTVITKETTL